MEDICEWPTGLAISIVPHEDSWKVVIMTDGPQDVDRCDMIQSIADRLRSQFRVSPMELIEEFLYRVKAIGPLKTTEGSPNGERNYWIVSEAEIDGPRIKGRLAAPGSDWMRVSEDGFWRPDVRAPFQTDDGETILMPRGASGSTRLYMKAELRNYSNPSADATKPPLR